MVLDSIKYCQAEKGLLLHCWCIMSNHVHLILSAENHDLSNVLGDFKKYTSKQIIKAIEENRHESRRECLPAGRQGCSKFSKNKEQKIAGIRIINSGDRACPAFEAGIISHRIYTAPLLFFKR